MALTLRPATATPRPHRLRHAVTGPVPVLVAASALAAGFLVLVADVVAKLG
jgi:ABC-type cobalamin transport system permease subunit